MTDDAAGAVVEYSRASLGGWTANVYVSFAPDDINAEELHAETSASTLSLCERNVAELLRQLTNETGRPCEAIHVIGDDPDAFVAALESEGVRVPTVEIRHPGATHHLYRTTHYPRPMSSTC